MNIDEKIEKYLNEESINYKKWDVDALIDFVDNSTELEKYVNKNHSYDDGVFNGNGIKNTIFAKALKISPNEIKKFVKTINDNTRDYGGYVDFDNGYIQISPEA